MELTFFIINGVLKVVTAETATTIGYKNELVTLSVIPKSSNNKGKFPNLR
jgi:hypothetical protein